MTPPCTQWLSDFLDVTQKLTVQGYQVHEIEVKDGAYEFEATDPDGLRVSKLTCTRSTAEFRRALRCDPCWDYFVRGGEAVVISAVSLRSPNEKCRTQQELKT